MESTATKMMRMTPVWDEIIGNEGYLNFRDNQPDPFRLLSIPARLRITHSTIHAVIRIAAITPGQRIGEGYDPDDKDYSTVWTKTTRLCGQGQLDNVEEDDSTAFFVLVLVPSATNMTSPNPFQHLPACGKGRHAQSSKTISFHQCIPLFYSLSALYVLISNSTSFLWIALTGFPNFSINHHSPAIGYGHRYGCVIWSGGNHSYDRVQILTFVAGSHIDVNVSPVRNITANVSPGRNIDANVSSGCDVDANVLPDRNVNANVSSGLDITVESIRSSFLQFLAANQLLDSAAIAAGFSDSFVDGLVYCLVGHGIGIRQLTG
ncbi:hypothetical protein C8R42DRAFT_645396 [Lentinula raphanica]|nr:hypothetical protein C8R42DRAFT_645396 [Lentinula raphanica]